MPVMDEPQSSENQKHDEPHATPLSHVKSTPTAGSLLKLRRYVDWAFFIAAVLYCLFHAGFVIWNTINREQRLMDMVYEHYAAIVGLPFVGYAALAIVLLLEARSGEPVEFSVPGFSFKGASGPIVLWVVCFMAISVCFKLLW